MRLWRCATPQDRISADDEVDDEVDGDNIEDKEDEEQEDGPRKNPTVQGEVVCKEQKLWARAKSRAPARWIARWVILRGKKTTTKKYGAATRPSFVLQLLSHLRVWVRRKYCCQDRQLLQFGRRTGDYDWWESFYGIRFHIPASSSPATPNCWGERRSDHRKQCVDRPRCNNLFGRPYWWWRSGRRKFVLWPSACHPMLWWAVIPRNYSSIDSHRN